MAAANGWVKTEGAPNATEMSHGEVPVFGEDIGREKLGERPYAADFR